MQELEPGLLQKPVSVGREWMEAVYAGDGKDGMRTVYRLRSSPTDSDSHTLETRRAEGPWTMLTGNHPPTAKAEGRAAAALNALPRDASSETKGELKGVSDAMGAVHDAYETDREKRTRRTSKAISQLTKQAAAAAKGT